MPSRDEAERPIASTIFHILIALADQPRHGYGIMLDVSERTDGRIKMSPGTLYGAIKQMLEDGLIEEVRRGRVQGADERRRYYRITPDGRDAARQEMARMTALLDQARLTSLRPAKG